MTGMNEHLHAVSRSHPLRERIGLALALTTLVITLVVLARRSASAFDQALPPALLWSSTVVVWLALWGAKWLLRDWLKAWLPGGWRWISTLLAVVCPFIWGLALAQQATALTWGGLLAIFGLILGVALFRNLQSVHDFPAAEEPENVSSPWHWSQAPPASPSFALVGGADEGSTASETENDPVDWHRRWLSEDEERWEGNLTAHFTAGQREVTLHLSFCPAFAQTPQVEAEEIDGQGWEVRVAACYLHGARLHVRRSSEVDSEQQGSIAYAAWLAPHEAAQQENSTA